MFDTIQQWWRHLAYLLRLALALFLFFAAGRILFILVNGQQFEQHAIGSLLQSFLAGTRLDVATTCYLLALPVLLMIGFQLSRRLFFKKLMQGYVLFVLFVIALIGLANALLYPSWGMPINTRALTYLADVREVFSSLSGMQTIFFVVVVALALYFSVRLSKWVAGCMMVAKTSILFITVINLIIIGMLVTGMRGGWQTIPLNESDAYHSRDMVLNHLALNPVYHLAYSWNSAGLDGVNPYQQTDDATAQEIIAPILRQYPGVLVLRADAQQPNIVIIILESWTAGVIEKLGGEKGVTPVFDSLTSQGLLFTNVYSSGFRTDQALPSIISGFPAQPNHSVMRNLNKAAKLTSIIQELDAVGYTSSFTYGGDLRFSNMAAYLQTTGFEYVKGEGSFGAGEKNKWGMHDEFLFKQLSTDLNNSKQPFVSAVLTLSTHEPFDVPMATPFDGEKLSDKFNASAFYCDYQLGRFFNEIKSAPWYDNTLFVLMADHGHSLPRHSTYYTSAARHVPLLFVGQVLDTNYRNTQCNKIGNSHDLATTLLSQLNLNTSSFPWSRNLLSSRTADFAYLTYDSGCGWIDSTGYHGYLPDMGVFGENVVGLHPPKETELSVPLAYLQILFRHFMLL